MGTVPGIDHSGFHMLCQYFMGTAGTVAHHNDIRHQTIQGQRRKGQEMKEILRRDDKKYPILRGKSVINLFYENSTRTRSSFEFAGKYLGADVVNINTSSRISFIS